MYLRVFLTQEITEVSGSLLDPGVALALVVPSEMGGGEMKGGERGKGGVKHPITGHGAPTHKQNQPAGCL